MGRKGRNINGEWLEKELSKLVGEDNVSASMLRRAAYAKDIWPCCSGWVNKSASPCVAEAIVWPRSQRECASVVRWCAENDITMSVGSVFPGGCGQPPYPAGGILVDLKKMDKVKKINTTNLTAEVQAGVPGAKLEAELNEKGLTVGPVPPSFYCRSVGDWLSSPEVSKLPYVLGKTIDLVLALKGVLPGGTVFSSKESPRSATGPDLDHLIMGSGNSLAVITGAMLAVRHLPEMKMSRAYMAPNFDTGAAVLRKITREALVPSRAAVYDRQATALLAPRLGTDTDGCLLVLSFEGPDTPLDKAKADMAFKIAASETKELGEEKALAWLSRVRSTGFHRSAATRAGKTHIAEVKAGAMWSAVPHAIKAASELDGEFTVAARITDAYPQGAHLSFSLLSESGRPLREQELTPARSSLIQAIMGSGAYVLGEPDICPAEEGSGESLLARIIDGMKKTLDPEKNLTPEAEAIDHE